MEKKDNIIFYLTNEMHNDVADIYEAMCDNIIDDSITHIDNLINKLRDLKNNIIKKDNY